MALSVQYRNSVDVALELLAERERALVERPHLSRGQPGTQVGVTNPDFKVEMDLRAGIVISLNNTRVTDVPNHLARFDCASSRYRGRYFGQVSVASPDAITMIDFDLRLEESLLSPGHAVSVVRGGMSRAALWTSSACSGIDRSDSELLLLGAGGLYLRMRRGLAPR